MCLRMNSVAGFRETVKNIGCHCYTFLLRGANMRKLRFFVLSLALVGLIWGFAVANDDGTERYSTRYAASYEGPGTDDTGDDFLTTLFASDNQFAGNSFDVGAYTPLTIVGFDINLDTGLPNHTIDVWTRDGTADGFEMVAAGWTLMGSDVVVPAGANLPTHVNVGGLYLDAGDTVGIIITTQENTDFRYTNGGPNIYTNSDMTIVTFRGLSGGFPPGSVFTYRTWNGTVHYVYGTALNRQTWGSIKATF